MIVYVYETRISADPLLVADITDSTNIAQGFAIIPISWSVGMTLGYANFVRRPNVDCC